MITLRHATGVHVFHNHTRRFLEFRHARPGRFHIHIIIERQFLALPLFGIHDSFLTCLTVQRRLLMWIFTVPERVYLLQIKTQTIRKEVFARHRSGLYTKLIEVGADHRVVLRGAGKHLAGKFKSKRPRQRPRLFELTHYFFIICGIRHHGHIGMVFGRGTHEGWPANVDVFDSIMDRGSLVPQRVW
ncbi:MAG: hypothetical protein ACD_62C00484G0002, partial [uncultured bacterium]